MRSVGVLPALALAAGCACAMFASGVWLPPLVPAGIAVVGWLTWLRHSRAVVVSGLLVAGFMSAGALLFTAVCAPALNSPLRTLLDRHFGHYVMGSRVVRPPPDAVGVRAVLVEDAASIGDAVAFRARVTAAAIGHQWSDTSGLVAFTVGGRMSEHRAREWRAGRTIETFATFRRPATYLNEGVPDFERLLALEGTTLFASVKSGLQMDVRNSGNAFQELAAGVRAHVRRSLERWVAPHDPTAAAIVGAVLVGDRSALPDEIRQRLQAAGTYHVIAISGGNIAILVALVLMILLLFGISGRGAAGLAILLVVAYAGVVAGAASVWRATAMAVLYLGARAIDHRTPPRHAVAIAAAIILCLSPLDLRDAGFLLTFGATLALIGSARATMQHAHPGSGIARWVVASLVASVATEVVLLPISAAVFSRVTIAGIALNLIAIPLMVVVQVAGLAVALLGSIDALGRVAGWLACVAARALVDSAQLVDLAPWLTRRVPAPLPVLLCTYYAVLGAAIVARGTLRVVSIGALSLAAMAIVAGQPIGQRGLSPPATLRLTIFDVGQGDATLAQSPNGGSILIDAGGSPFGSSFDIGGRVLAPALWASGVRRLDDLLLTHGDPDHIGGAAAILDDFRPTRLFEGIPVHPHTGLDRVRATARRHGVAIEERHTGDRLSLGGVQLRVLHPGPADWARSQVRNDDSLVVELRYGRTAILLLGDISASVERDILPLIAPADVRILKVAHHGSRTSTSEELLQLWKPQIAVISCGRANTFGHPAPEVLQRLDSIGARIYRTDLDGQITVDVHGNGVEVQTYRERHGATAGS